MEKCLQVIDSWVKKFVNNLNNSSTSTNFKLKQRALNYVLVVGDLYKNGCNDVLLKCVGNKEFLKIMTKVHEELCESDKASPMIK